MIKNSSIPYFFNPPVFVAFIFDAPKSDLFSSIAAMVDIFTSAYVTSLLFYLMVDYAPSYKQEQISNKIITPKLVSLYSYISELLAMIEYSAKLQGLDRTEKNENFDELQFESSTIFCKKRSVINGADKGASVHFYNLLIDCDKYRNLILTTCKDIAGTPNFSNCDEEIVCIISEIQLSQMLQMLLKPDDPMLKIYRQIKLIGIDEGFRTLSNLKERLKLFIPKTIDYSITKVSKEEYNDWKLRHDEALALYPQISKFLKLMNEQNNYLQ